MSFHYLRGAVAAATALKDRDNCALGGAPCDPDAGELRRKEGKQRQMDLSS